MVGWHHRLDEHESKQALGDRGTGKPGELQSTGSQKVKQDLATEQQEGVYQSPTATICC